MYKISPGNPVMRAVEEGGAVVGWEMADIPFTQDLKAIALRHGEVAEDGVTLHVGDFDILEALRQARHALQLSKSFGSQAAMYATATVEELEAELAEVLAAPIRADVQAHWKLLGGV